MFVWYPDKNIATASQIFLSNSYKNLQIQTKQSIGFEAVSINLK